MRAMRNWLAVLESLRYLPEIEIANLEEVVDAKVDGTIFESYNEDIRRVSGARCQGLKQCV